MKKLIFMLMLIVFGCVSCIDKDDEDEIQDAVNDATATATSPIDLSTVTWLHTNVSGWSQTGTLHSVNVSGQSIALDYDKATTWKGKNIGAGSNLNGNPWIFVKIDGKWYAGTWEWLRYGQTAKAKKAVAGDHVKKAPLTNSWKPSSGTEYGFMISGLARDGNRNVEERTNIVMYTWP